jgi:hypothetical protein
MVHKSNVKLSSCIPTALTWHRKLLWQTGYNNSEQRVSVGVQTIYRPFTKCRLCEIQNYYLTFLSRMLFICSAALTSNCILCLWILYDSQSKQGLFLWTPLKIYIFNGYGLCSLWGTDRIIKYYLNELWIQRVKQRYYTNASVSDMCEIYVGNWIKNAETSNYCIEPT